MKSEQLLLHFKKICTLGPQLLKFKIVVKMLGKIRDRLQIHCLLNFLTIQIQLKCFCLTFYFKV